MKKKLLKSMRVLLVAAGLCVGASAWAQNKAVAYSIDYESASDVSDWVWENHGDITATLATDHTKYGKFDVSSGNGNRSGYKALTYTLTGGFADESLTRNGFVVEFDALMYNGKQADRSVQQFVINTSSKNNLATNGTYSGDDAIFSLYCPTANGTTWKVNGIESTTEVTLTSQWYHYQIVVTETSATYTITDPAKTGDAALVATGSKALTEIPTIKSIWTLLGRNWGRLCFDNFEIYQWTAAAVADAPTFALTAVNQNNKTYTITNPNAEGSTIYYTTTVANTAPEKGDAAYSTSTNATQDVTIGESGTIYAYVQLADGVTTSTIASQVVNATPVSLNQPSVSMVSVQQGDGYLYNPVLSFTAPNNDNVLFQPETEEMTYTFTPVGGEESAETTITVGSTTFTPTANGTLKVYAKNAKYASGVYEIAVSNYYTPNYTYNFDELTSSDFSSANWASHNTTWWDGAEVYYSTASSPSTLGRLRFGNNSVTDVVVGWGVGRSGNTCSVQLRNWKKGEINLVITHTSTDGSDPTALSQLGPWLATAGSGATTDLNSSFNIPNKNTAKTHIVYAPADLPTLSPSVEDYATFSSLYALNFASATGVKAYYASASDGSTVTMTKVEGAVAAGTGLLLQKVDGEVSIPVASTGTDLSATNLLKAGTGADVVSDAEYSRYVLAGEGDATSFYNLATAYAVPVGKAYLEVAKSTGARLAIVFSDDETTGIANVEKTNAVAEGIYNLNGQRVAAPQKGLYIVNGKKVIKK